MLSYHVDVVDFRKSVTVACMVGLAVYGPYDQGVFVESIVTGTAVARVLVEGSGADDLACEASLVHFLQGLNVKDQHGCFWLSHSAHVKQKVLWAHDAFVTACTAFAAF